jgi:hypothetical protein
MPGETKSAYIRRISVLEKNSLSVETNIGYTLLNAHHKAVAEADLSAYETLENQKEMLAASIVTIQDIALSQKEIQSKLSDIRKAKKDCMDEQVSAHEALGKALYEHYAAQSADFFAESHAEISLLYEKITTAEAACSEADIDESPKNLFTRFISNVRASSRDSTLRHLASQLKKLYIKAGNAAVPHVTLLAESDSLVAGILPAFESYKEIQTALANLAERESALALDFEANIQALSDEGVIGLEMRQTPSIGGFHIAAAVIPAKIADINRQITAKTADENALAAKVGKAYTDTVLTEEGAELKAANDKKKKANNEKIADSLLAEAAEIRNEIARCKLSSEILDVSAKIEGKAKIMRQGNERILDNHAKIKRLTEENAGLEAQIAEANDQRKELTIGKVDLEKRLDALAGLAG